MRPANPSGPAAKQTRDARARFPERWRHKLDCDLPAASAAPACRGRRARRAATDALAGLPVLAIVRHHTPLSARFRAEQRARIGIPLKSQVVALQPTTAEAVEPVNAMAAPSNLEQGASVLRL